MACGCTKRNTETYTWTDGTNTVVYNTEIQAKAKVIRMGGSYLPTSQAPAPIATT